MEWNGIGAWTLGICACRWNSQVSPTAPWSGATLNPEHQDQRSIMAFREVHFPLAGWRTSPTLGAMQEPLTPNNWYSAVMNTIRLVRIISRLFQEFQIQILIILTLEGLTPQMMLLSLLLKAEPGWRLTGRTKCDWS